LHFGLGSARAADSVVVIWTDGVRQVFIGPFSGGATWTFLRGSAPSIAFDHHPTLLGPLNGAHGLGDNVRCRWRSSKPVVLEFSTSPDFTDIILRHGPTSETSATLAFPTSAQPTYWRAWIADDSTKLSSTWEFRTGNMALSGGSILKPERDGIIASTSFEAKWHSFYNPLLANQSTIRYNIRIQPLENPGAAVVDVRQHSDTTLDIQNLQPGVDYELIVSAYDKSATHTTSVVRRFRALDPPQAPLLVLPKPNASGVSRSPVLSVSTVSNADAYEVEIDLEETFQAPTRRSSTSTTLLLDIELQPLTPYVWRARASNAAGNGEWSGSQQFITGTTTSVPKEPNSLPQFQRVMVYDMRGALLATSMSATPSDWTHTLPTGVYVLHFVDASGQTVEVQRSIRSSP
jgi:hypothetical protein